MRRPRVAITIGDFDGIGPEVVLKSVLSASIRKLCDPVLIGPIDVIRWWAKRLNLPINLVAVASPEDERPRNTISVLDIGIFHSRDVRPGKISPVAGTAAALSIHEGVRLCLARKVIAVVTAPVSKAALNMAGYSYPGQTEMLAELTESEHTTMMLVSDKLRVGLATVHVPLREVATSLSIEKIFAAIVTVDRSLRKDFGVRKPRVAVLGLNPHAGEGGLLGTEDDTVIRPAVELAKRQRLAAAGPFSSDSFFGNYHRARCDATIAMYHDQGLIPLKILSSGRAVNFSAGLKIVRTSPDHGTAFDIAGKGVANPRSMIEAIRLAVEIGKRRQRER